MSLSSLPRLESWISSRPLPSALVAGKYTKANKLSTHNPAAIACGLADKDRQTAM
jgi:hypothetical protein